MGVSGLLCLSRPRGFAGARRPLPPPPSPPFNRAGELHPAPTLISTFPCQILAPMVRAHAPRLQAPGLQAPGPVQLALFWFFDRQLITNNILARVSVGACLIWGC